MDLEVVGRHAFLFDDDGTAAFVDSGDALVEWNSLLIDRYDVRHLLSSPPPPRGRRNLQSSSSPPSVSSLESELDHERYHDLPPDEQELDEVHEGAKPVDAGSYRAVAFSYENSDYSADQKNADAGMGCSGFSPPFPVPESLLKSLPPTEKVHQIIARTAMFVSKHGGQSEIVLRVKQGNNPAFGFLMPDHHLHAYFRFLVDHQELLEVDIVGKSQNEVTKADAEHNRTNGVGGGALSLLGSMYGFGDDEDGAAGDAPESKEIVSGETFDAVSTLVSHGSEKAVFSMNAAVKDEAVSKHLLPFKEKASALRRNSVTSAPKAGSTSSTMKENDSGLLPAAADKSQASASTSITKIEPLILEPPSDLKRLVDKIVEFIMRNGKQFEAVLVEQDTKHGRFPFLLPSNQYHPYYLKVLQRAQESKFTGKSFLLGKDDLVGHVLDKKTSLSKESDTLSLGYASCDMPYDSDRKEKFKMVIGKSKKDGHDPSSKATEQQFGVNVDAFSAAAILQAATRGIKNPNLGILSGIMLNGNSHSQNSEGGQGSGLGSLHSSHPEGVIQKSAQNGEHSVSAPVAKAIAKTAALEAASEADSSEAHLTREQQLKAERLKRAKMFVAMLKSGAAPLKTEPLRGLSVEPQESGVSGSFGEVNLAGKEREGSSVPLDASDKIEKSERKHLGGEYNERRSRRKYRSRSSRHEDVEENEEEENDHRREHKHSRKKHHSHYSSHEDDHKEGKDEEERGHKYSRKKRWSHRSSHEDDSEGDDNEEGRNNKHSRKKHRSHRSSREEEEEVEDEDEVREHKHRSHRSSHHSRDRHKHRERHSSSKDRESRHRHKHDSSSDKEHRRHDRSDRRGKRSHLEREELEEGEISSKISDQSRGSVGGGASREASLDLSSSYQDQRGLSQPSETTEVSDDLRTKIRAMLMATL